MAISSCRIQVWPARPLRCGVRAAECGADHAPLAEIGVSPMTVDRGRLTASERRALIRAPIYRVLGTPVVAALGLANTAIVARQTGAEVFGLVSLIATITLLLPFADLGIGATA